MPIPDDTRDFDEFIQLVCNVMEAYTVAFLSYDPAADELTLRSHFSLGNTINPRVTIRSGQGMIGWVAKERKPLAAKEFSHDATTLKLYTTQEDIKSFLAVPVMDRERLMGVLTVDSKRQYVFTPKHQKVMADFASALARLAVRHERVRELTHEAACIDAVADVVKEMAASERLSHIVRILHANVGKLVEHSGFIFALKSPEEGVFNIIPAPAETDDDIKKIPLHLDQSLMGWVIRKNQPLNHHDVSQSQHGLNVGIAVEGIRSFLGVPMVVRREVIGALGVVGSKVRAFTTADMKILSILGSIAASYVAGAYAYGQSLISRKVDTLTGLGNYLYLEEKIAELDGTHGALLALDIDNFRKVTDEFSVAAADAALVEIARFFHRVVAQEGYVTRYYGDVFLIYLRGHNREEAGIAAQKLLDLLKAKHFFIDDKHVIFEGKIGVAFYPRDGKSGGELIKRAFNALKSGKGAGTVAVIDEAMKNGTV
ncbi:MAG: GGDEF domain-containing protein [Nitrospinae bacterium]|nr:GGDEF domain-containing protein [Nitrospinota bacterium]